MTEVVTTAWNLGAAGSINGYPIDGEYVAKWNPQCCFKCKMVDAKGSNEGVSTPVMFLTAEMWSPRYENTFYTIKMEKFELISSPQEWMKAPSLIKGKTSFPHTTIKLTFAAGMPATQFSEDIQNLCGCVKHSRVQYRFRKCPLVPASFKPKMTSLPKID